MPHFAFPQPGIADSAEAWADHTIKLQIIIKQRTRCMMISLSRVQGSEVQGSEVQGSGVQGSRFKVQGSGFRAQGSGFRVQGSGFRVQGSGFKVQRFRVMLCLWPRAPSLIK